MSGSSPIAQPRTTASKSSLFTRSRMKTAHSSDRTSTLTPSRRQAFWAITMIAWRSSFPEFVMSVNASGFPSFSRIPSAFFRQPASFRSRSAPAGSWGRGLTSGS